MKVKSQHAQARDAAHTRKAGMPWPRVALTTLAIVAIFIADTTTYYEVAVSVFYAATLLAIESCLSRRGLWIYTLACLALMILSFALSAHGDLQAGLINLLISLCAIMATCYLIFRMRAARWAAQQAQSQLIRMARIHSLEGLTVSIAHEINQPLAAIVSSANAGQRWLNQTPPNLHKAQDSLARMAADAQRAGTIIARIRGLTRSAAPQQARFEINAALTEILALSKAELERQDIALNLQLQEPLPAAYADRVQIQQVAANLLLNAIESLRSVAPEGRYLQITTCQSGEHFLQVSFSDTGAGITESIKEHLFDAFWSTKSDGIGVGLSLSRTIIEANGGRIWLDEDQSQAGACFHFLIPMA